MLIILKARLSDIGKRYNTVVAYDNFDFHVNVRHQVSGKTGIMRSVTTAKVFLGHDIPESGLLRTMLHEDFPLDYRDIMVSGTFIPIWFFPLGGDTIKSSKRFNEATE